MDQWRKRPNGSASVVCSLSLSGDVADALQDIANERFRGNFSAAVRYAIAKQYKVGDADVPRKRKGTPYHRKEQSSG